MKKIFNFLKNYWKDPVWSKVIAAGIIFVLGSLITTTYAFVKIFYSQTSFKDSLKNILDLLSDGITIPTWVFLLLLILYSMLVLKPFVALIKEVVNKARKSKNKNKKEENKNHELPKATEHSTVLFSYRMAKAFPGIRDVTWFNDPVDAIRRLKILLKEPLRFQSSFRDCELDPIWWFRGGRNLFIDSFKRIGRKTVLMNIDQLRIKRIAAYHGDSYYLDFVYVVTSGENQTGLYKLTKEDIKRQIETFGYSWEEYGLIDYIFWKKPIRREDYEDGATVVRGKVKDAGNAKLRVRYISDYNFIIAAKGSPYNSQMFERISKDQLNGILKGNVEPNTFFGLLKSFHKNEQ